MRLLTDKFDVVLLGLNLPESSGYETFLRVHEKAPSLPIVVISGVLDDESAHKAIKGGAQDYLLKTEMTPDLLARSIFYSVERNRIEEELVKARDKLKFLVKERTADLENELKERKWDENAENQNL